VPRGAARAHLTWRLQGPREKSLVAHTVLIVDDSPSAGPELRALLESDGYTVLSALRAEEALDMLRNQKVDLIITEALLPGMDGFELVRQMRRTESGQQMPIIILTVRSAPEDYATSYEAGADEYFMKPMEPPKIIAATRGLITRYEAARASGMPVTAVGHGRGAVAAAMPQRSERGELVTVFSLKGGVGCSTIAVNLAVAIKVLAPSTRVGLIDLALEQGSDALLLDIVPTSTIADWAREDLTDATPYLLNQYFVQHRSGISVLSAPASPEQAETVRPDVVRKTLELAPLAFDYVVVDTPATFSEISLTALEHAQTIVLPVTPDMAALKTAVNTMRILKAVKIDEEKIRVVLNEIIPRAGLSKQQVETSLNKPPFEIPHAGPAFIDAANHGMPLVTADNAAPAARALLELARTMCEPETAEENATSRARFNLLERLRRT